MKKEDCRPARDTQVSSPLGLEATVLARPLTVPDTAVDTAVMDAATVVDGQPTTDQAMMIGTRYRIVRKVGEGGQGVVYEAVQLATSRRVAVKVMEASVATPVAIARMKREAGAAARIGHPDIVQVFDFEELPQGGAYMAMELLTGRSLADVIKAQGQLSIDFALWVAIEVSRVLAAAHRQKLVHRDLKPENLFLVTGADGKEHIKLLDFGLAADVDADAPKLTVTGGLNGSPSTMAPEQVRCAKATSLCDVYGLGAVLYWMVTGHYPHFVSDQSCSDLFAARLEKDPLPANHYRSELSEELVRVLVHALMREPEYRIQSMTELERALCDTPEGRSLTSGRVRGATKLEWLAAIGRWCLGLVMLGVLLGVVSVGIGMATGRISLEEVVERIEGVLGLSQPKITAPLDLPPAPKSQPGHRARRKGGKTAPTSSGKSP